VKKNAVLMRFEGAVEFVVVADESIARGYNTHLLIRKWK
jgi:hypothetical protein